MPKYEPLKSHMLDQEADLPEWEIVDDYGVAEARTKTLGS